MTMTLAQKLRYALVGMVYLLLCSILLFRLWDLALNKRDFLLAQSKMRVQRRYVISSKRSNILDRHGKILAMSAPDTSFWLRPKSWLGQHARVAMLAKALDVKPAEIEQKLKQNQHRNFYYILRHASAQQAERLHYLIGPDLFAEQSYSRAYPAGLSTSALLGYTDTDNKGLAGLEYMLNGELMGKDGYRAVVVSRDGSAVQHLTTAQQQPGHDVHLTIDKDIQYHTYEALKLGVEKAKAKAGYAVVVDAKSAEIIAAASYNGIKSDDDDKHRVAKNPVFTDLFEPGSTFKPFALGFALDCIPDLPSKKWNTSPGKLSVQGHDVIDVHDYGVLNAEQVLVKSSNIGMVKIMQHCKQNYQHWLKQNMQVTHRMGLGYPAEPRGRLTPVGPKDQFSMATLSFGYGMSMSIARLAQYYTALANEGVLRPLRLVKENGLEGQQSSRRILSARSAKIIRKMLKNAVSKHGTGSRSRLWGVEVAGKTGTAHKNALKGGYDKEKYVASFAGMAPAEKPRFVVVVLIDEPEKRRYYGGLVAAPVFSEIILHAMFLSPKSMMEHSLLGEHAAKKTPSAAKSR